MKFLLPCGHCGRMLPIEVSQAGEMIACSCGQTTEAPTMRGIRQLEPAEGAGEAQRATQAAGAWSGSQGALFSSGLLVAFLAGVFACFYGYRFSQIDATPPPPEDPARVEALFQKLKIEDLVDEYAKVREVGIGGLPPPQHVVLREYARYYQRWMLIALTVLGVSLIVAASSFLRPRARGSRG